MKILIKTDGTDKNYNRSRELRGYVLIDRELIINHLFLTPHKINSKRVLGVEHDCQTRNFYYILDEE